MLRRKWRKLGIKRVTNSDKNFYKYIGRIFGSREVQRITSDHIYDNADKEKYISTGYKIIEEKKNFLTIRGGKNIEQN